jgi:RimJ/RimL family protein N-acetyltransferase
MEVQINDINLLKYAYFRVTGEEFQDFDGTFPADKYVCFGEYHQNKEPLWVVYLYNFQRCHDCFLDIALNIKGLFSRQLFVRIALIIFDYVFKQAKLIRCTITVRQSNKRSLRLVKAWGFKEEGYQRLGCRVPNVEDMHILGMLKSECAWI